MHGVENDVHYLCGIVLKSDDDIFNIIICHEKILKFQQMHKSFVVWYSDVI